MTDRPHLRYLGFQHCQRRAPLTRPLRLRRRLIPPLRLLRLLRRLLGPGCSGATWN
jgi:hypothetical protein